MKNVALIGLVLFGTSAFAAENCNVYLRGVVTSAAINKLVRNGYKIVDSPQGATYEMETSLLEINRHEQKFNSPLTNELDAHREYYVYFGMKVEFSKNGSLIQRLNRETFTLSENNFVAPKASDTEPLQKKIIRKVGKCSL